MPRYELMYLIGSHIPDNEVSGVTSQVLKFIEEFGGSDVQETNLGKKKLSYPIKKTRNGVYVVVNFTLDSAKVNLLDARIRTQNQNIIRYILVNQEDHLKRKVKDLASAAKMVKPVKTENLKDKEEYNAAPVRKEAPQKPIAVNLPEISSEELDKKIEQALGEDLI